MRIRYVLKSASQSMVSAFMYIIMTCFKFLLCCFGSVVCITRNKFGTCTMWSIKFSIGCNGNKCKICGVTMLLLKLNYNCDPKSSL